MMSFHKYASCFAGILTLSLAAPGVAPAGVVLDQQNVISDNLNGAAFYYPVLGTEEHAQTFTVGVTGSLVRISLEGAAFGGDLTIELLRTTNGVPDLSNIAATLTVLGSIFPSNFVTLTDIDLGTAAFAVTSGDVLAIALSSPQGFFGWTTDLNNPYSNGEVYSRLAPDPFQPAVDDNNNPDNTDNGFRTYVDNSPSSGSPVPEPSTPVIWSILLGMFGVGGSYGRLKRISTA
jgi:hypothetical protein